MEKLKPQDVNVGALRPAIAGLKKAGEGLQAAREKAVDLPPFRLAELNAILYRTERAMLDPAGLPGRDWYRHQFYAPGLYTGYDAKTLPGIREAIEQKQWALARRQLEAARKAIEAVAREVHRAAGLLK